MYRWMGWAPAAAAALVALAGGSGCDSNDAGPDDGSTPPPGGDAYALASIVINADGTRITYLQAIHSIDGGHYDNVRAIEAPGNGVLLGGDGRVFLGLAEQPVWIRYELNDQGRLEETGRLSFGGLGASAIDYGNAYVDESTAVSVLPSLALAVIWNPSTMEIVGEVELPHLAVEGFETEVWTTEAYGGLVYVPGRWANWEQGRIREGVSTTILDPYAQRIVAVAEDDRCASGGRVVFDEDGYAYVMGDGRNYSIQMFAHAAGTTPPQNCILRIPPGGADFEEHFYYAIPSLTGGLEVIDELSTAQQGTGIGFAKMFYPDRLPEGLEPVDFQFWSVPAHRLWRIVLGDPPTAEVVEGAPFSTVGFTPSSFGGKLYLGESQDGATSEVYEVDPSTNTARSRFSMDGYFAGLFPLR